MTRITLASIRALGTITSRTLKATHTSTPRRANIPPVNRKAPCNCLLTGRRILTLGVHRFGAKVRYTIHHKGRLRPLWHYLNEGQP